ncbi:MAG: ATP-binding protein [Myxococcota bacterium]
MPLRAMRLSLVIPLVIGASALVVSLAALMVSTALGRDAAFAEGERATRSRLGQQQHILAAALRRDDPALVEELVASMGGERLIGHVAVVRDGRVLASNHLAEVGEAWSGRAWPEGAAEVVAAAQRQHGPAVRHEREAQLVWGAIALSGASSSTGAVLVFSREVGSLVTANVRNARLIAAFFAGLMLLVALASSLVFQRVVARRTAPVFAAAQRLAAGNLSARVRLSGDDEVGQLARAFDEMAQQLEQRQREISAAEQRYRAIFEQAADGIFVADRQGRYLDVNQAGLALCGYSLEEIRARSIADLSAPEEEPPRLDQLREQRRLTARRSIVTRSGERIPAELAAAVLPDGGLLSVVRDLRPRFEADRLRSQAQHNERLAVLGQLAAGVGHEINNPLTFVLDHLVAAIAQLPPGALRTQLEEARDGAERIARIVSDLRIFGRADAPEFGPVSLEKVVRAAVNLSGPATRERVRVSVELAPTLPRVHADERRLCQVLLNLVQNATFAMPTERDPSANTLVFTARAENEHVVLEVRDNGRGMSPEVLARIFEPYFTTRGAAGGTGLGLAVSRQLLEQMNAHIEARSAPGEGAVFSLRFEVDRSAPPPPVVAVVAPAETNGKLQVLIIDDEPAVARVAARLLKGHEVALADGPASGLEACRAKSFDVVFCDLSMPGGGGAFFFAELKKLKPELAERVVFITGGASSEDAARFLDETRQPVLQKPYDPGKLRALALSVARRAPN